MHIVSLRWEDWEDGIFDRFAFSFSLQEVGVSHPLIKRQNVVQLAGPAS